MLALMRLTWIANRQAFSLSAPFIGLCLWIGIVGHCQNKPATYWSVSIAITVIITWIVAAQRQSNIDSFIVALPITRSRIVQARFATSFIGMFGALCLPIVAIWLCHLFVPSRVPIPTLETIRTTILLGCVVAVGLFVFLLSNYLGGLKTRTIIFFILGFIIIILRVWQSWYHYYAANLALVNRVMNHLSFTFIAIGSVSTVGLISLCFSIQAYNQRRF